MAYIRQRMCSHSGCKEYALSGSIYCAKHQRNSKNTTTSQWAFMYNSAWKKASRQWLQEPEHSWCEECLKQGRYTPANTVHHKIEHKGDWGLFWDKNNWQALCMSCHSSHHITELNKRGK